MMEILRRIQSDMAGVKIDLRELKTSIASLRQQVHVLEGHILRQETSTAMMDVRIERIEGRLDLRDS